MCIVLGQPFREQVGASRALASEYFPRKSYGVNFFSSKTQEQQQKNMQTCTVVGVEAKESSLRCTAPLREPSRPLLHCGLSLVVIV